MSELLDATLSHLRALVAFDTRNPPRRIDTGGIFDYLRGALPGFRFTIEDSGDGCISLLAVRGAPHVLFNFHVDTVPANEQWSRDPFELAIANERATGLGSCDIKGAAAAMLTAATRTRGDLALLFSSDEEAGGSVCVRRFVAEPHEFTHAIVAEPTRGQAVLAHRGYAAATARFRGVPGHASAARALADSAVHRAVRWAGAALEYARELDDAGYEGLSGVPFNVGRIEGGMKANMIAGECVLRFGFRPLPDQDPDEMLAALEAKAPAEHLEAWEPSFIGPPLPGAAAGPQAGERARRFAESLDLTPGAAVSFWTEASLFSAAGLTAIVFGPGDIAQAHAADEWVALAQLQHVTEIYLRIIDT